VCGRYRLRSDKQRIAEAFDIKTALEELYLEPNDDVAPGSMQPVIFTTGDHERNIQLMRWGFKTNDRLLFNARSETLLKINFWKESFERRRCLVPADCFFEWAKSRPAKNKKGKKPKYEFTVGNHEPFAMAGLWSPWKNQQTGQLECTFAIITTQANEVTLPVHDRQPAVIQRPDYEEWLSEKGEPPVHLLCVLPEEEMQSQLTSNDNISDEQVKLFDSR
jgi:putative SOS response-associated peptidase YedK